MRASRIDLAGDLLTHWNSPGQFPKMFITVIEISVLPCITTPIKSCASTLRTQWFKQILQKPSASTWLCPSLQQLPLVPSLHGGQIAWHWCVQSSTSCRLQSSAWKPPVRAPFRFVFFSTYFMIFSALGNETIHLAYLNVTHTRRLTLELCLIRELWGKMPRLETLGTVDDWSNQ